MIHAGIGTEHLKRSCRQVGASNANEFCLHVAGLPRFRLKLRPIKDLSRSPDGSRSDASMCAFPGFPQDKREVWGRRPARAAAMVVEGLRVDTGQCAAKARHNCSSVSGAARARIQAVPPAKTCGETCGMIVSHSVHKIGIAMRTFGAKR